MLLKSLALTFLAVAAGSNVKTAEEMLAEIKAVKNPVWDTAKSADHKYRDEFAKAYEEVAAKRAGLILNFYEAYPDHEAVPKLMEQRWAQMRGYAYPIPPKKVETVLKDVDAILAKKPKPAIVQVGLYTKAQYRQIAAENDAPKLLEIAEEFIKAYPKDPKGANLLRVAAEVSDRPGQIVLYRRLAIDYPTHEFAGMFKGTVRRLEGVGKPFDLKFKDAVSGKEIDAESLKGKVVLVDFWATWCGPCIAKMPELKKLYSDYKEKGLEIVGISLDTPEAQGGLKALKEYVAKENVTWPQYYQGNGWDSEFSTSWGIMAIPSASW